MHIPHSHIQKENQKKEIILLRSLNFEKQTQSIVLGETREPESHGPKTSQLAACGRDSKLQASRETALLTLRLAALVIPLHFLP